MKNLNIVLYISRYIYAYPIILLIYNFNKKINLIHLSEGIKEFSLIFCVVMTVSQIVKFLIIKGNGKKIYDDELARFIQFEKDKINF